MITKTHVLDRMLAELKEERALNDQRMVYLESDLKKYQARNERLKEDILTIEQLIIDLFPEPGV